MLLFCMILCLGDTQQTVDLNFIQDPDFYKPISVKVDAKHRIFVVDGGEHHVRVFNSKGEPLMTLGSRGQGPGEFNNPSDVAFLKDNRILVGDSGQQRLHFFKEDGTFEKMIAIHDQAVGQMVILPDGNLLLTKSSAGTFSFKMGEEFTERFGIFNLEGKQVAKLGTALTHENPLLSIMLNAGDVAAVGSQIVQAPTLKSELIFFDGPINTSVRYPLGFEPVEPNASMKEVKNADGSSSFSMSVNMDVVCVAMAPCSESELLLLRNTSAEDDPTAELVKVNLKGKVLKVWEEKFHPTAIAVGPDGKFAYIINDVGEDTVISRVAL